MTSSKQQTAEQYFGKYYKEIMRNLLFEQYQIMV